jgi:hypothetical protein
MLVGRLLVLVADVDGDIWWWRRRSRGLLEYPDDLLEEGPFGALLCQGKGLRMQNSLLFRQAKSPRPARVVGNVYPHGGSASSSFCSCFSFMGAGDGGACLVLGGSGGGATRAAGSFLGRMRTDAHAVHGHCKPTTMSIYGKPLGLAFGLHRPRRTHSFCMRGAVRDGLSATYICMIRFSLKE